MKKAKKCMKCGAVVEGVAEICHGCQKKGPMQKYAKAGAPMTANSRMTIMGK